MILSLVLATSLSHADPAADAASAATADMLGSFEMTHKLTVQGTGHAPKTALHFRPKPGSEAAYEMVNKQNMTMSMVGPDGVAIPLPGMGEMAPKVIVGMKNKVGEPNGAGLIPVHVAYTKMRVEDVPEDMKAEMMKGMAPLEGMSFVMMVAPKTGKVEQVDVNSSGTDEAMYGAMQSMMDGFSKNLPSFPEEPVGVGASWTIDTDMNMAGLQIGMTQTVTLTKIDGDIVEMDIAFAMDKGDSELALPGMPPDAKVDFTKFDGSGTGHYRTNLATMATQGKTQMKMDMGMTVGVGGQPPMAMDMSVVQQTEMRAVK